MNQLQGINFTRRFQAIIDRYNERREDDVLNGEEFDTFSQEMTDIIYDIKTEMGTWADLGIDIEEKAFSTFLLICAINISSPMTMKKCCHWQKR